jgi:hypothetical protein
MDSLEGFRSGRLSTSVWNMYCIGVDADFEYDQACLISFEAGLLLLESQSRRHTASHESHLPAIGLSLRCNLAQDNQRKDRRVGMRVCPCVLDTPLLRT